MSNGDGWDFAAIDAYHDDEVSGRNGNETEAFDFDEWGTSEWDNANTLPGRHAGDAVNDSTEPSAVSSPVRFDSPPRHATAVTLPSIRSLMQPATSTYPSANSHPGPRHGWSEQATASQSSRHSNTNGTPPAQRNNTQPSRGAARHNDTDTESETDSDSSLNDPVTSTARMPPSRRPRHGVVDLTDSTASATRPSSSRKRRAEDPPAGTSTSKRKKPAAKSTPKIDTSEDEEAPSAEAELLKAQQLSALKAQEEKKDAPQKIGQRTCIICLENYTNATVAICGHIFCHECLTRALIAGEKHSNIGNCPACRKPISRKKKETIIPIAFMKKSAYAAKGRPKGFLS